MPTYDYQCDACKHQWEEFQSMSADPTKKCPKCKKSKARRLISAGGGLIFRGSGFYLTDYRSDSYKKAAEADTKGSQPKGESSAGSSADSSSKGSSGGGNGGGGSKGSGKDK